MSGFVDEYLPDEVPGYPCISTPRWRTSVQTSLGGRERRNQEWAHPLMRFTLPEAPARGWPVIEGLKDHWYAMAGPAKSWPFRDPTDKASRRLLAANEPDEDLIARLDPEDQVIGTANNIATSFQLVKTYTRGGETYERPIHLPVLDTVRVAVNGVEVDPGDYSVSRPGGVVSFTVPPEAGAVTACFLFDVEVRFEDDDVFDAILRTYQVGGFADLSLLEVRPC